MYVFFLEKSPSNVWGIYESTLQTLLEKDPQNSNFEESSENREIFSASRFDRATGVTWRIVLTIKIEGPPQKKLAQKSRNSRRVSGGGVGAQGQLTRGSNGLNPETKYKRSRNAFPVISIAHQRACRPHSLLIMACFD